MQYGAMKNVARAPFPTPAPSLLELNHKLERRQDASNTCGQLSSLDQFIITCPSNEYCNVGTAGFAGCCDDVTTDDCIFYSTCFGSEAFTASCSADPACSADISVARCTNTAYPYCAQISYDMGYQTFICTDTIFATLIAASEYTNTNLVPASSTNSFLLPVSTPASSSFSTVGSSTSPSTTPTPSPTLPNQAPITTPTTPVVQKSGLATGAIAAIAVVGGLVLIAAFVLVWFLVRHRKHKLSSTNVRDSQMMQDRKTVGGWVQDVPASGHGYSQPSQGFASHKQDAMSNENESTVDGTVYVAGAPRV